MRNLKKFLALVLAMVMAFSLMITANAAIDIKDDEINDTFYDAVALLDQMGVFKGDEDGFRPNDTITRGEVAAVIYRIATADTSDRQAGIFADYNKFLDVHSSEWFAGYVNYCNNAQFIKGDGGYFRPYDKITGYEVLAMILRVVGYDQNHEFEGSGWEIRTASIARTEGVLKNITEGTLGTYATRQVVAEMIYQAIQIPTVSYTFLQNYQKNVLVQKTQVSDNAGVWVAVYEDDDNDSATPDVITRYEWQEIGESTGWVYDEDVYNTILYTNFNVVGKRTVYGADDYGRPLVQWVTDHSSDTVQNGGKYIVNYQAANGDVTPAKNNKTTKASYTGKENTRWEYYLKPVKVYTEAVDECTLVQDINSHRAIAGADVVEYLNGGKVETRVAAETLHALHTDDSRSVNAQGRTLEVYKVGNNAAANNWAGSGKFVFVYIDTLMGVVKSVTPRTRDTAGHVMTNGKLEVEVNGTVTVVYEANSDFETYKVGDLVLLQTHGFKDNDGTNPDATALDVTYINSSVPTLAVDFLENDDDADSWAVDILGPAATEQITVNATLGTKDFKTGLVSTSGVSRKANVVYLANAENPEADNGNDNGDPVFYQGDSATAIKAQTTVPAGYGIRMTNETIGQTYTVVLDKNNNVVGMTRDVVKSDVGVITGIDSVRIGTGRYAVEADMVMMDGTKQTVRFLDDETTDGVWDYFTRSADADDSIGTMNGNANVNVLVRVEPFTKDGATYHKVTATHNGDDFTAATADDDGEVVTGVADTLTSIADYNMRPAAHTDNIDDNTRFIIAEIDYRYNNGTANVGGYTNYTYTFYKGFKNIPTIVGDDDFDDIMIQRIGNDVFIYPNMVIGDNDGNGENDALVYTMKNKVTVPVDETYLVVAPVRTEADKSIYKVLKDGVETTLEVLNDNLNTVNKDVEDAMVAGQLIRVDSRNTRNVVTSIVKYDSATVTDDNFSRTIAADTAIYFNKTGVIGLKASDSVNGATSKAGIDSWLTVAEGCTVQIVNLQTGNVYQGSLDSIRQYDDYVGEAGADASHRFVYELDANGYVSHLYIID